MSYRIIFVIAILAASGLAQSKEVNLNEAVQYALTNNLNLRADRKQLDGASGKLKQAGLRANPMLETSGLSSLTDNSMKTASVMMTLPLEAGGRRLRRINVAERELTRLRYEIAERERQLAANVRTKYADTIEAMRTLELSERLLELNQNNYDLIKARVTEGASAPLEQKQLQVELNKLTAQKQANENRVVVLLEELKSLLGVRAEEPLKISGEFLSVPVTLTKQELIGLAIKTRPDLQAARAAESVADAMTEQAKTEGKYDLSVFAEFGLQSWRFDMYGVMPETGGLERISMTNTMVRAGMTITLPTRNKNQGNIEAAVAASEEARLRREFIETIVRREVNAAWLRYEGAARVLKIYDTELLAAAQNNLRVVRASFELGYLRLMDVLAEQKRLVEIQMNYVAAQKELFLARSDLDNAVGKTIEK